VCVCVCDCRRSPSQCSCWRQSDIARSERKSDDRQRNSRPIRRRNSGWAEKFDDGQRCVRPRASAVDMTLSVFAAERRAAAPLLLRARSPPPSILSARRSAVNPLDTAAAVDWWDRQTDGRTLDSFIHPAPLTMRALSIQQRQQPPFYSVLYRSTCVSQV